MNKIKFDTGGFPLSTNILDAMQNAYVIFNTLGNLAGSQAIIFGCDVTDTTVSNGVVFLSGEILEFRGGSLSQNVIIKEDWENRIFENGSTKQVIAKRYVTFGSSTPEKTFAWADFKRAFPTTEIKNFKDNFEERIRALETRKSPIPIGLIAIWNKPANEPIPEGWRECTDLRGRMPLGWNPDDSDFNTLGKIAGEKKHTLTIEEMPKHNHNVRLQFGIVRGGKSDGTSAPRDGGQFNLLEDSKGGDQPHNNMPPYIIIKFIEFVGF